MEYEEDIPTNTDYWRTIRKDSLVIIDDLWSLAANSVDIGKAFKVYSKKIGFSLIIVSQVSCLDLKINPLIDNSIFSVVLRKRITSQYYPE